MISWGIFIYMEKLRRFFIYSVYISIEANIYLQGVVNVKKYIKLVSVLLCIAFILVGCGKSDDVLKIEEPPKADRRPMVMVKGEIYLDTGKESDIGARCGVMDGEIISSVEPSEIPTENNQSNFGKGYGYQHVSESSIDILMNGKWIRFVKEKDEWGVQLTATQITPTGLTLVCNQLGGNITSEPTTGSYFNLEVSEDNQWKAVKTLPQKNDIAWTEEAWIIPLNDSVQWKVNWEWLYGKLPEGNYRIAKKITDSSEGGESRTRIFYAYFEIAK